MNNIIKHNMLPVYLFYTFLFFIVINCNATPGPVPRHDDYVQELIVQGKNNAVYAPIHDCDEYYSRNFPHDAAYYINGIDEIAGTCYHSNYSTYSEDNFFYKLFFLNYYYKTGPIMQKNSHELNIPLSASVQTPLQTSIQTPLQNKKKGLAVYTTFVSCFFVPRPVCLLNIGYVVGKSDN